MLKTKPLILLSALLLLMSGCVSSSKMALQSDIDTIKDTSGSIYLMTVTLKNQYKESFQPSLVYVNLKDKVAKKGEMIHFSPDPTASDVSDTLEQGNNYFLSMGLKKGDYSIQTLTSNGTGFLVYGTFITPLLLDFHANESGVYYLGHIDATVRERKGDEFKAGPSIPLLDQAAAGASGGTFDVSISDQWEKDKAIFLAKYQSLKGIKVKKQILSAFNREAAQDWWEKL